MTSIAHLVSHLRVNGRTTNPLALVAGMVFFFVLFDGVLSYLAPIIITDRGFSVAQMGIIYSTSSIAGMLFDFALCRLIADTQYRRIFLGMFALAVLFPLFLFSSGTVFVYVLAMVVWGFYYDLYNIGQMDFVGRTLAPEQHTSSFGVLRVFDGFGYLIAPLIASMLLGAFGIGNALYTLLAVFFIISVGFFLALRMVERGRTEAPEHHRQLPNLSALAEFGLWERIGKVLAPVLLFTLMMNIIDAAFWTIGPLVSESLSGSTATFGDGSLFMVAYMFPTLFVGWFVGYFTLRAGKKHTAFAALGVGSLILAFLPFTGTALEAIGLCFISATAYAFAWPAIAGAYADYVSEALDIEREITTLQDAATNVGYVVGPILSGAIANALGYAATFSLFGIGGVVLAVGLYLVTPRSITLSAVSR